MNDFTKFMSRIPEEYVPRIERSISRAVEVLSDPYSPGAAYDAVARELGAIQRDVGTGAAEAWRGEVSRRVTARQLANPRDVLDLENQLAPKLRQLLETAEQHRQTLPAALATVGKVVLGLAAAAAIGVAAFGGFWSRHRESPVTPPPVNLTMPSDTTRSDVTREIENSSVDDVPIYMGGSNSKLNQELTPAQREELAELKKPEQRVAPEPVQVPPVIRAEPLVRVPRAQAFTPFNSIFRGLKAFAIAECSASAHDSLPSDFYNPDVPLLFSTSDDAYAAQYAEGVGDCERRLFFEMISVIRAGRGAEIDGTWVGRTVESYRPAAQVAGPSCHEVCVDSGPEVCDPVTFKRIWVDGHPFEVPNGGGGNCRTPQTCRCE
jgi:hypothetical protein